MISIEALEEEMETYIKQWKDHYELMSYQVDEVEERLKVFGYDISCLPHKEVLDEKDKELAAVNDSAAVASADRVIEIRRQRLENENDDEGRFISDDIEDENDEDVFDDGETVAPKKRKPKEFSTFYCDKREVAYLKSLNSSSSSSSSSILFSSTQLDIQNDPFVTKHAFKSNVLCGHYPCYYDAIVHHAVLKAMYYRGER